MLFENPVAQNEIEQLDVSIGAWGDDNTKALTAADPNRQALVSQSRKRYMETYMQRAAEGTLRWVGTQFPCHAAAQDAEMSLADYEQFVFSAGLLHLGDPAAAWRLSLVRSRNEWSTFSTIAKRSVSQHPAGTDLTVGVEGRTWIACNGENNFPDGEVFSGPIEDATTGMWSVSVFRPCMAVAK